MVRRDAPAGRGAVVLGRSPGSITASPQLQDPKRPSDVFEALKSGGFMFKQWKEKYLVLTMEGSLLVCRDAESPPDQGFMSPLTLQRRCSITPCITDRDHLFDSSSVKDPGSPRICEGTPPLSRVTERGGSLRDRGQNQASGPRQPLRSVSVAPPHRQSDCLRHGNSSDARAVRAVCLLMGGAAASSALGYLNSCAPPAPLASRAPEIDHGEGGSFHACSQDVDSPHFNSFDFEGDSDFDAFDCGGFAF
ncbi:hypothetical protein F2P81_016914 [Scophthalmus maximus]|uniref:PH domain-containing protein n=1 Tax=Scophthalmus maximus TaxID=52904 RepID=A0A6A4S704_SCOMX|nr:hypothetical protein F2P81_016914 [Scophthalmus maximus]